MIRCKFRVDAITNTMGSAQKRDADGKAVLNEHGHHVYEATEMATVKMSPVYSSNPGDENAKFWAATPQGSIEFGTVNKAAVEGLKLGGEYYIDITPAG